MKDSLEDLQDRIIKLEKENSFLVKQLKSQVDTETYLMSTRNSLSKKDRMNRVINSFLKSTTLLKSRESLYKLTLNIFDQIYPSDITIIYKKVDDAYRPLMFKLTATDEIRTVVDPELHILLGPFQGENFICEDEANDAREIVKSFLESQGVIDYLVDFKSAPVLVINPRSDKTNTEHLVLSICVNSKYLSDVEDKLIEDQDFFSLISSSFNKAIEAQLLLEQLRKQNDDLEIEVSKRTETLKNSLNDLKVAKERILEQDKFATLGKIAGEVAHEINNPLTILKGSIGSIKRKVRSFGEVNFSKDIDRIDKTIDRIASTVRSLKNISRDGKKDPFQDVCLVQIVNDSISLAKDQFKYNCIDVSLKTEFKELRTKAREVEVSQIILNLLSNSRDAIKDSNAPWIKIGLQESDSHFVISVSDSGKGISPSVEDKIFDPFYTTKDVGEGTGIGLGLSRDFARNHGGDLILNKKSANTEFLLKIPKDVQ